MSDPSSIQELVTRINANAKDAIQSLAPAVQAANRATREFAQAVSGAIPSAPTAQPAMPNTRTRLVCLSDDQLELIDEALRSRAYSLRYGQYEFGGEDDGHARAGQMYQLCQSLQDA